MNKEDKQKYDELWNQMTLCTLKVGMRFNLAAIALMMMKMYGDDWLTKLMYLVPAAYVALKGGKDLDNLIKIIRQIREIEKNQKQR